MTKLIYQNRKRRVGVAKPFAITNARIVLPDKIIPQGTILVKGRKIAAISRSRFAPAGVAKIDARTNYVAPGFIDLHIHGDVERVSRQQVKGGTTGFLATLHPARPRALLEAISQVLAKKTRGWGAKVLGIRLEGPFLNRAFCGALPPEALRRPDINEARKIIRQAGGALKMVVLAPELKEALKLIRLLRKHKIIASLGHTGATYEQAIKGVDAGIRHATHTFNRMRQFHHCRPGALGAALTDNRVVCEVIPEENHVHPAALKLLLACKGLEKVALVTDSTAAQEYPPKKRRGDVFRLKDGTLYGTALTLNRALKNAIKFLELALPEAVRLVTLNPARVLQIERRKGSLAVGKDADIVIFDRNFNIKLAMVEGKVVYKCAA
ncbi:MAG: N-acetylglucosamine-6-phosphate deacetylase [Candidatus Omnitrophica bacterium]|nr:N-acetylglucosamine-6-phosphate deacetylase [Candidatus Omnitrophota bacterium]